MNQVRIGVVARAPVPGAAKTRLIPRVGASGAARLQGLLIRHALRTALAARVGPVSLWCSPDCDHPLFAAVRAELAVSLHAQTGRDLGERMLHALETLCAHGPAMLIGVDCPALTPALLREAASALAEGRDGVVVPSEDGGYALIGLRAADARLFDDVAWGTGRVMAQTRERLHACRMTWRELPPSWDVDRPEDFDRLLASGLIPGLADERWIADEACHSCAARTLGAGDAGT